MTRARDVVVPSEHQGYAMLPALKELQKCLQSSSQTVLDKTVSLSGLQAVLCARYGYGLTVKCEDKAYFFHLPDIATDSRQASLLEKAAFPDEESLLRLRRRTRPGMTILEACIGCGMRSVFYAKSMQACQVYAFGGTERNVALGRKNILLNEAETVALAYCLDLDKDSTPSGALDSFCRDQKIKNVDLISLDRAGLAFASLEGATEILRRHGPAIIIWEQWGEEAARTKTFLDTFGYAEPETWTPQISFWVSRV